jgi:membrane fusion protein, multidrug efflux system
VGAMVIYWRWPRGAKASSGKVGAPPVMINTVTARSGDIGVYVQALGTVTPRNTVSLTARVSGQITKVEYQEGQLVHAGEPMVEIDPAPYQAAVTQAEGQLVRDQAQLANAKINLARDTDLLAKGVISQQEYDAQNATFHQSEGAVELDEGNLEAAKINLAYCHVTSPIDGLAGLRLIDPGNIVQANGTNPLVVITQLTPITIEFDVAEDDVRKLSAPCITAVSYRSRHTTAPTSTSSQPERSRLLTVKSTLQRARSGYGPSSRTTISHCFPTNSSMCGC